MGLKLKKFRAELNWKSKKTSTQVICLRYQLNSEFEESLSNSVPATSTDVAARLHTSDVIKERKSSPKPTVNNIFERDAPNNAYHLENDFEKLSTTTNGHHHNENSDNTSSDTPNYAQSPQQLKGILKHSSNDQDELTHSINPASEEGDYKKSTLIFMTEDHDNTATGDQQSSEQFENSENTERKSILKTENHISEISEGNNIKLNNENGESESENEETETDITYESRGGYSSQAASIFFAGEEPEPMPRVRKTVHQESDDENENTAKV